MANKCCCGCFSLSTATILILSMCVVQIAYGIIWSIQLLMLLDHNGFPDLLLGLINVDHIDDFDVVHGLVLATVGLNVIWLIFVIMAARANTTLNHGYLAPWIMLTYLITLFDVGSTIYFAVKVQGSCDKSTELIINNKGTKALTNLTLLVLFSRGGIMWFINVYFALVVEKRGKEIDQNHSALAFYIVSHLARRSVANPENAAPCRRHPPSYSCPNFNSPSQRDSSGSSWSLSSETFKGFTNPCYGLIRQVRRMSSSDLAQVMAEEAGSPPAYEFAESSCESTIAPY